MRHPGSKCAGVFEKLDFSESSKEIEMIFKVNMIIPNLTSMVKIDLIQRKIETNQYPIPIWAEGIRIHGFAR